MQINAMYYQHKTYSRTTLVKHQLYNTFTFSGFTAIMFRIPFY